MNLSSYDIECLHKAKQIISADLRQHISIADLSQKVALGSTKLKNGFTKHFGTPIYSYLRMMRMDKAVELLTETDRPIKEIARATGFRYAGNFMSAFKIYHGCTPKVFRLKQRENKSV